MAKGNDGNYLQHCIEVEAAMRLTQVDARGKLHIAFTHGMEPFEKLSKPGQPFYRLLYSALEESRKSFQSNERKIVTVYRKSGASKECYPNSAELMKNIFGADKLSGGITEINCDKHKKLMDAWSGSNVKVACSSWRDEIDRGCTLACPDNLQTPWLFTMDPMTYREEGNEDDDKLHRSDICRLASVLGPYFQSGNLGMVAIFVYSVGSQHGEQTNFWKFVDDLAESINVAESRSYWLPHNGGNENFAGLLFSDSGISHGFEPPCLKIGRGNKRSDLSM